MAMIYCRECGYKHSDKAKVCPKCGAPSEETLSKKNLKFFLTFFEKYIYILSIFVYNTKREKKRITKENVS